MHNIAFLSEKKKPKPTTNNKHKNICHYDWCHIRAAALSPKLSIASLQTYWFLINNDLFQARR